MRMGSRNEPHSPSRSLGSEDPWPERNDSDYYDPVGSAYDSASDLAATIDGAEAPLRTIFAAALFHLWERHCNAILGNKANYSTKAPGNLRVNSKYSDVAAVLQELELVANCSKHGPGHSARRLFALRSELFPRATLPEHAGHLTLVLSEDDLRRYFWAVSAGVASDFELNAA